MSEENGSGWKWFLAVVPSWNGDWLFQADGISSARELMESKLVTIRRQTKVFTDGNLKAGTLRLVPAPYMPFVFSVIDDQTEGCLKGEAIASAIMLEDDAPLVVDVMKAWIPESVTPADAGAMKAEIHKFDRTNRIIKG